MLKKIILCSLLTNPVLASEDIADQYPASMLYSKPVEVIPDVFSAIGATAPSTYENAGHNNNLSFIMTGDGVVVINGGGSYLLAQALHEEIKSLTDQPVRLVINENGQGHAMLGNSYWADQGVKIVAHIDAAHEFEDRGAQSLNGAENRLQERAQGSRVVLPDETFEERYTVHFGTMDIQALHIGPSHSPGDIVVWLQEQSLVIAGDIAFHERMLPIFEDTITIDWLETWEEEFEKLAATYVIPGHGHPTNMDQVRRYTRDYLVYLREKVGEHLDAGGDLAGAYYVDQSPYAHLDTFEELATKNACRVFEQMEFEYGLKLLRNHGFARQFAFCPQIAESRDQSVNISLGMNRRLGDAQTLRAALHRGIVDRLNVNAIIAHQDIGYELTFHRIPDNHWYNMARILHMRNAERIKARPNLGHAIGMGLTLLLAHL